MPTKEGKIIKISEEFEIKGIPALWDSPNAWTSKNYYYLIFFRIILFIL